MGRILLIGDIVGCGNLGMSAMIPILSKMGHEVCRLHSSLVSNNFCYGDFAVLDTTEYMRRCIDIWEKLDFRADAVATGYLVSEEQTRIVSDYCALLKQRGAVIFVDPIMADDGKLYNGATENTVEYMRRICGVADIILPNFTEAKFLTGRFLDKDSLSKDEAIELADGLHSLGCETAVISSMVVDNENCTLLHDCKSGLFNLFKYERIQAQFSGTGDVFSSFLIGNNIKGIPVDECVQRAMDAVYEMILASISFANPSNGIPVERLMQLIR